jgi:dTDP-4-amino-4,6-dideoxygalactose transaminase
MIPFHRISMKKLDLDQLQMLNEAIHKGEAYDDLIKECFVQNAYPLDACDSMLLTHSATASLELMALTIGIRPGDEVIMPSFTYAATANAFAKFGAVIKFVDIEPLTLNLDPSKVEAAITTKTRAIVPIHYGGIAADMAALESIAVKAAEKFRNKKVAATKRKAPQASRMMDENHKIYLCEDASHTIGASYRDKSLGTLGDMGCISFHHSKNITSGGSGGSLFIKNKALRAIAEEVLYQGTDRMAFMKGQVNRYNWQRLGGAYDMPVMQQIMLLQELSTLKNVTERRRNLWVRYHKKLMPLVKQGHITLAVVPKNVAINGHIFYIKVNNLTLRDQLMQWLKLRNIETRTHYEPLHATKIGTSVGTAVGNLSVTHHTVKALIRLPLYNTMKDEEQDDVVTAIYDFFK